MPNYLQVVQRKHALVVKMKNKKYVVLVFEKKGLLSIQPRPKGFPTTSLFFARWQAEIQKKIRKSGTPIALGQRTANGCPSLVWDIVEWPVPWRAAPNDPNEKYHTHLSLWNGDLFED